VGETGAPGSHSIGNEATDVAFRGSASTGDRDSGDAAQAFAAAMDPERLAAFARKFAATEGTPARVDAVMAWFDSFGEEDFEPFIALLFAIDEDGDVPLGSEDIDRIGELSEWVFEDSEALGSYPFDCWAKKSPDSLVRTLASMPPEKAIQLGTYVLQELLKHSDQEVRDDGLETFFELYAQSDPGAAIDLLRAFGPELDEDLRLMERQPQLGIRELYRRDPDSALELLKNGDKSTQLTLIAAIEGNEARKRLFESLPEDSRGGVANTFFASWAQDDPVAAFEASAGHPGGSSSVVQTWIRFDDEKNIYAAVGERFAESPEIQNAIIDAWSKRDPWTAGETLLGDGHGEAVPQLITSWVERDSVEASRFIRENLEPGEARDQAVQALAQGIAARDPMAAQEWAETIASEPLRATVLRTLAEIQDPSP